MNARQISEQGIGLLPDIEVEYTLEGIQEERDEILEKRWSIYEIDSKRRIDSIIIAFGSFSF